MTLFFDLKHLLLDNDRLIRATVPVIIKENLQTQTKFYLLLSFDIDANVKDIIENDQTLYYQIKQISADDSSSYSEMVVVKSRNDAAGRFDFMGNWDGIK